MLAHSAAFWFGHADLIAARVTGALLNFSMYPVALFDGPTKLLLFTLFPAALIGAVPAQFVQAFTWRTLGQLSLGAGVFVALAVMVFYAGLRRYESGSAIQSGA